MICNVLQIRHIDPNEWFTKLIFVFMIKNRETEYINLYFYYATYAIVTLSQPPANC